MIFFLKIHLTTTTAPELILNVCNKTAFLLILYYFLLPPHHAQHPLRDSSVINHDQPFLQ